MNAQRILLDIEAQRDFFTPGGSCYERSASDVAAKMYELFAWARSQRIPVMSTVLRVRRGSRGPLAARPHCIEDSDGERKISGTVLHRRINLGMRNITDLPDDLLMRYQQVIFEKRDTDIFKHARAERMITQLPPVTFILCGAGLARGIVQATVGLRRRGFPVIIASDAVLSLHDPRAKMACLRMEAKGAIFLPTRTIVKVGPEDRRARRRRRIRPKLSLSRTVMQGNR